MLSFNFNFTPIDMVPTYKQEFDLGWITRETVKSYVDTLHIINKEDYKTITGEAYEATQA
ncbi:XkdX family protein [Lactobacillus sp.]|uniref:XkdX family protein n=1 Tax=Lactobacillus sp. TaxID=1591 RepID=UPI0019C2CDFC|nr:XkdX family protein [Lactobacillus sp.]MBD5429724.1 XkdX family protein [Lactobacillus sp.]